MPLVPNAPSCAKCGQSVESVEAPHVSAPTPVVTKRSMNYLWIAIGGAIVLAALWFGYQYFQTQATGATPDGEAASRQSIIEQAVQTAKSTLTLPAELDAVTTWVDVTAAPNAVRYHYVLHDVDESKVTDDLFRNYLVPVACGNEGTRTMLDADVHVEYSYTVRDSKKTFFVSVTKADCI